MFLNRNFLKRSLRLVLDFFLASAFDHKNAFALRIFLLVAGNGIFYCGLPCCLMLFRQFPTQCQAAVAKDFQQFPQRFQQMMRRERTLPLSPMPEHRESQTRGRSW